MAYKIHASTRHNPGRVEVLKFSGLDKWTTAESAVTAIKEHLRANPRTAIFDGKELTILDDSGAIASYPGKPMQI